MLMSERGMPNKTRATPRFSVTACDDDRAHCRTSETLPSLNAAIAPPYISIPKRAHVTVAVMTVRTSTRLTPNKNKGETSAAGKAHKYGNHIPTAPANATVTCALFGILVY